MAMHPYIKILCLLVTIILLVTANPLRILVVSSILLLFLLIAGKEYWLAVLVMCKRMKWFWLSLFILYGWFVPGSPIVFIEGISMQFIPSIEGVKVGGIRAIALLNIIGAVVLMMKSTIREEFIVSIMWLISPLRLLNVETARFSARLVLTLVMVINTENKIKNAMQKNQASIGIVQRGINSIASLLTDIEKQASKGSDTTITLPQLPTPALYQWLIPIILVLGLQRL